MTITPDEVFNWLWKNITDNVIVGALFVFLYRRFRSAFDEFSKEVGRIEAQSAKIDTLVRNTEKLTVTTETIKGQITDEFWLKQQLWLKRLDAYSNVIGALDKYGSAMAQLANAQKTLDEAATVSAEAKAKEEKVRDDAVSTLNEAARTWSHAKSIARLCCDEGAVQIVESLKLLPEGTPLIHEGAKVMRLGICAVAEKFIEAARRDLGYKTTPSSGTT